MEKLKIMLDPGAIMPTRAYPTDAGLDIYTPVDFTVESGCRKTIDTGVHVAIPKGYVGMLTSKSGLMHKYGILTTGTIDADYRGSIRAVVFNEGWFDVNFKAGDKITQLVIEKIITPELEIAQWMQKTDRGSNGFGSTGR